MGHSDINGIEWFTGHGWIGLLLIAIIVLGIAALIKYFTDHDSDDE